MFCSQAISRREIDLVAAWSVDRLGRSLQDLIGFIGELHANGVDLYLHQQGIDTTTPAGRAMFQMLGVFAEFERAMIQERVRAGLARARAKGAILRRPRTSVQVEDRSRAALAFLLELRRSEMDLLIVCDGDNFQELWPIGNRLKHGSLKGWESARSQRLGLAW